MARGMTAKIECPFCHGWLSEVYPGRLAQLAGGGFCRYRRCLTCDRIYETIEVVRRAGKRREPNEINPQTTQLLGHTSAE